MAEAKATEPQQDRPDDAARAEIAAAVEVILFAADKPMPAARLNEVGALGGVRNVRRAVDDLNARYEETGRAFRIAEIAGGYQFQTLPEYGDVLGRLRKSRSDSRLSQAAMETLAIVAYRQPVLRADVEAVRGVACGEVLRSLLEKNMVISIEPGVYVEGVGGFRHSDTVLVTDDGCVPLTQYPDKLEDLVLKERTE